MLDLLSIQIECPNADFDRLPTSGPAVVVANHPHGLLDGLAIGSVLSRRRNDVRILANSALLAFPGLEEFIIPVEIFDESTRLNGLAARAALRWLHNGGMLVTFPAGEVSVISGLSMVPRDREWSDSILKLARATEAKIFPVYISGRNSLTFLIAGLIHPWMRTALLGRELLNKKRGIVEIAVGKPLLPQVDRLDGNYLRARTYMLSSRVKNRAKSTTILGSGELADAVQPSRLEQNVRHLPPECLLLRTGDFSVYVTHAEEIPDLLNEIGRLRELTFRAAGEGVGNVTDLDQFDRYYRHLFLWNSRTRELIGAYRMGLMDEVAPRFGLKGFYTNTLFDFGESFMTHVSPGIELGRSFVRPEYQKLPHPLYLLWRGIGLFVCRSNSYRYLFGSVSISNNYTKASRELIIRYFHKQRDSVEFRIRSRNPFLPPSASSVHEMAGLLRGIDDLANAIDDLEPGGKRLPVLLRHYLRIGAEVMAFNVDRRFSNALDAFIVVDLLRCSPALVRYFGRENMAVYLAHHGVTSPLVEGHAPAGIQTRTD